MEMHSQECWLPADNGACVAAMTLKSQKTRPKFFQDFQSSNQHGTVVKSPFFKKNARFMGTVSGPAGCFSMLLILFWVNEHPKLQVILMWWPAPLWPCFRAAPMQMCLNIWNRHIPNMASCKIPELAMEVCIAGKINYKWWMFLNIMFDH